MSDDTNVERWRIDPNYYRLSYHLAAQRVNWFAEAGVGALQNVPGEFLEHGEDVLEQLAQEAPPGVVDLLGQIREAFEHIKRLERAIEGAKTLIAEANEAIELVEAGVRRRALPDRSPNPGEERLLRFLKRTVEPCAQVLLAGGEFFRGQREEAEARVTGLRARPESRFSYRVHYNLACYEATRAAVEDDPDVSDARLDRSLEDLRAAFRKAGGQTEVELIQWAETDPSLAPLQTSERHASDFQALLKVYRIVRPIAQPLPAEKDEEKASGESAGPEAASAP
jgi:hypothetical protein